MILSVTVLGSSDGTAPGLVGKRIVDYLEGGRTVSAGLNQSGTVVGLPSPDGDTVAYYADSAGLRPGKWVLGRTGDVDAGEFAVLLAGHNPITGEPLLTTNGVTGRGERVRARVVDPSAFDRDTYSVKEGAVLVGVSAAYLRRVVERKATAGGDGAIGITRDEQGAWRVGRDALRVFAEARKAPRIVAGYDLTFSAPKSISVLWAGGDEATRAAVLESLDESVDAGLRYISRHGLFVRDHGQQVHASKLIAADYLHTTSRALDPQLHHHVVVANVATGPDGVARALDARMLFHEAKTASYVAGAELRHQLTARLGVTWTEIHNGIAEIDGIPAAALAAMSTRAKEIDAATNALGTSSAKARQVAAWDTRAPKDRAVSLDELDHSWDSRLAAAGYDDAARAAVLSRVASPALFSAEVREQIFTELVRSDGITESAAVFDRRTVVQRLAELTGNRLAGDAIDALADRFLLRDEIVRLGSSKEHSTSDVIRRNDGTVVTLPGRVRFTTEAMLAVEQRLLTAYERGRESGTAVVPREVLDRVLEHERFARLSDKQRNFVSSLVGSGMRIQAAVGAAGTGKTTALDAAVAAWEAAGFHVVGAAVGGTQAIVLGEETGTEARTVASLFARYFDYGDTACVDSSTVLLVDEASLLSTRDFAALARIAEESGAALRVIGDPAQHSAVAAGGAFRYLIEHHAEDVPALTHLYRQQGVEMEEVRLANAEYREGKIKDAIERLQRDGRITEAESADDAFDLLTTAWYAERTQRADDPDRRRSAMTAEHHFERRELNERARALLAADGTLSGPSLTVAGNSFQRGDEVIARVADRSLSAEGSERDAYVRNGSLGTVAEVRESDIDVDFERWGRVEVPLDYLQRPVSPGVVGGLQHAYALTTHAAQGETFAVAAPLITDGSSTEGVYVGITRGQFDLQGVAIRRRDLYAPVTDDLLPRLEDETAALRATASHLATSDHERLASELVESGRVGAEPCRHDEVVERDGDVDLAVTRVVHITDEKLMEITVEKSRELHTATADADRLGVDVERRQAAIERLRSAGGSTEELQTGNTIAACRISILNLRACQIGRELSELEEERLWRGVELAPALRQFHPVPADAEGYDHPELLADEVKWAVQVRVRP